MNYMVVTLFNQKSNQNVFVYQKSRTEYKIKSQIGHNSYSIDYVWGLYELARTCFCYLINGYSLVNNNLGYSFANAIHSGDFSDLIEPEEPSILTRTENVIIEPEKECPWKLAD